MSWTYLEFELRLESSVLATVMKKEANSATTAPFVPGSVIRGAVADALLRRQPSLSADVFRSIVLDGAVRFLNAYPAIESKRSLPVPVSLRAIKGASSGSEMKLYDLSAPTHSHEPGVVLTAARVGFIAPGEGGWRRGDLYIKSRTHVQRDRKLGKAWTDENEIAHGALYSYESLEPQQTLYAVVQVRKGSPELIQLLKEIFEQQIFIGRSRRSGYGRTHCTLHADRQSEWTDQWLPTGIAEGAAFRVLLTSDCVARDQNTGQVDPSCTSDLLSGVMAGRARLCHVFNARIIRGGYNRKWGLPLPQTDCAMAGSIFVFEALRRISKPELQEIEAESIGERTAEGYGRFLFMPSAESCLAVFPAFSAQLHAPNMEKLPPMVHQILRRVQEARVAAEITRRATDIAGHAVKVPVASLLSRLRTQLRSPHGLDTLRAWMGEGGLRPTAMAKLESCKLKSEGNTTLTAWIVKVCDSDNNAVMENQNSGDGLQAAVPILKNVQDSHRRSLLDATLAALAKKSKAQEGARNESL